MSVIIPEFRFPDLSSARRVLIERRKRLFISYIIERSRVIQNAVMKTEEFRHAEKIACFVSAKGEPDTSLIISSKKKKIFLPVVRGDSIYLTLFGGVLKRGIFGIPEPPLSQTADPGEIDLFIVPGVLFDIRGFRAGYGKGFYDRMLSRKKKEAPVFALAWSFQVFRRIPHEKKHDVFVDFIFTERFFVNCREGRVIPLPR